MLDEMQHLSFFIFEGQGKIRKRTNIMSFLDVTTSYEIGYYQSIKSAWRLRVFLCDFRRVWVYHWEGRLESSN